MIKIFVAFCAAGFFFVSSASGQGKYYTSWVAKNRTGNSNKIIACAVAMNQEKMESDLQEAGWPSANPDIDWRQNFVIIIAPLGADPAFRVALMDLRWERSQFVLYWGRWNYDRRRWLSSSITVGQPTSKKQVMIVVVKRYTNANYKYDCKEIRP